MSRKSHHVVSNPNGGWDVKKGGSERASFHSNLKNDAINAGRQISQNQRTGFVIHNKYGRISQSDSHGNDPCPPRDKNFWEIMKSFDEESILRLIERSI